MARVALLSVETAARMVADEDFDDPVATMAISFAAGPQVLAAASTQERARGTMLRYLARMGGRATPYGLFAGTFAAPLADERSIVLQPRSHHEVRVRVDVEVLEYAVREALDEAGLERWPLRANPVLRIEGQTLRYARSGDASADVISMRFTPVIAEVLRMLDGPAVLGCELIDALQAMSSKLSRSRLRDFLGQLVDSGLLYQSIDLIEPGVEPGERAVSILERVGDTERARALRALLAEACGKHSLDTGLLERVESAWRTASARISTFTGVKPAQRFDAQVEMATVEAALDRRTVADLQQAIVRVEAMASGGGAVDDVRESFHLDEFRESFRARYGDAEVPLLTALDLESGVLQPWHRKVSELATAAGVRADEEKSSPRVNPAMLKIVDQWMRDGGAVDITGFPAADRSSARAVLAAILDDYEGTFRSMLIGGAGRAPSALLARFCLGREQMRRRVSNWMASADVDTGEPDERPIHAELVYHPGGRIGNVLIRPRISDDAIALTGASGGTLPLGRLLIQLRGDDFRLRDADSGRPVMVELNTAHNVDFFGLDPVYTVLGHLASPGGVGWSWGALARLSHLPRVTCGTVIVAPEQWRLGGAEVRAVLSDTDPTGRLRRALSGLAGRRWIGVGNYDHVLPTDLECSRSVGTALARHTDSEHVQLVEMPQVEAPAVRGPTGRHVAEVVVPLGPARRKPPQWSDTLGPFDVTRGRSWVYFKYYSGLAAADVIISRARHLADDLYGKRAITDWFFVRYQDDGYHVRVRMRPARAGSREPVVTAMDELGGELQAEGLAHRSVMDDYVPEVARYGGPENLRVAESLFTADSDQVGNIVSTTPAESVRLYQAVADMLHWCSVLFDSFDEQHSFLQICQDGLGVSFTPTGNRQGKFYRAHHQSLDDHLAQAHGDDRVAKALVELSSSTRALLPEQQAWPVFGSALHMHCNRLFAFDAVRLEYLGYELALRKIRQMNALRGQEERHERPHGG